MDQPIFSGLLTHVRRAPLAADKFYLLQNATRSLFLSPAQCLDIVHCFTHSEDKAAIMDLIEKRIFTRVDPPMATLIVKSAAFSKDRMKILKALSRHLREMNEDEAKLLVWACFDSERDKMAAWTVLKERFQFTLTAETSSTWDQNDSNADTEPAPVIFRYIENMAKSKAKRVSAFDLPLLDGLSLLRKTIIDNRQAIADEVEKRHRIGHEFPSPSRISEITRTLKPGCVYGRNGGINNKSKLDDGPIDSVQGGSNPDQCQSSTRASIRSSSPQRNATSPKIWSRKGACAYALPASIGNRRVEVL